jgi:hypothetical protein
MLEACDVLPCPPPHLLQTDFARNLENTRKLKLKKLSHTRAGQQLA